MCGGGGDLLAWHLTAVQKLTHPHKTPRIQIHAGRPSRCFDSRDQTLIGFSANPKSQATVLSSNFSVRRLDTGYQQWGEHRVATETPGRPKMEA